MKLHLYEYECQNCEKTFKSPQLIENAYGEFLMRSERGEVVYLNTFEDKVFDELKQVFIRNNMSELMKNIPLFQTVFTITCDFSSEGGVYRIGQKPVCPACRESNIGHWGPTNPPEVIEKEISHVTHEAWNKLSDSEKTTIILGKVNHILKSGK